MSAPNLLPARGMHARIATVVPLRGTQLTDSEHSKWSAKACGLMPRDSPHNLTLNRPHNAHQNWTRGTET